MRSYLAFAIAQLAASSAIGAQYRPSPHNSYQTQMNLVVDQQTSPGKRDLTIRLIVPNVPTPPVANTYAYYTIYIQSLADPSNTIELVKDGVAWSAGQSVTVNVSIPESHYSDGTALYMCMGNAQGCIPTQNLFDGAPAPAPQ
jgi:hypothetical protein